MNFLLAFNQLIPVYRQKGSIPTSSWYLFISVSFIIIMYFFETYLSYRQYLTYFYKDPPKKILDLAEAVETEISEEKKKVEQKESENQEKSEETNEEKPIKLVDSIINSYAKTQSYGKDRSRFSFIVNLFKTIESLVFLICGFLPYIWDLSAIILARFGYSEDYYILRSLIIISIDYVIEFIIDLPFDLYSTFVIEEKHGFNKQTIGLYFKDQIKSLLLMIVIGYPLFSLLLYIISKTGTNFVYYVWFFFLVVSLIMVAIYPVLIAPLFNKYTPLEEGELRSRIESLAKKVNYPLKKLFVVDGSTRSGHSNAYLYGFFNNKRIVLYDTLLEQIKDPVEIEAIIGHELGHWKYSHTVFTFLIQQIYTFVLFSIFGQFMNNSNLYSSFGFIDKPIAIGLILFGQCVWSPIDEFLSFLINFFTRMCEYAADNFSTKMGYGKELSKGLLRLNIENLNNLSPDSLYSMLKYSHPTLVERITNIENNMKKMN